MPPKCCYRCLAEQWLGRRRISVGLSQISVERYQWQTGIFWDICHVYWTALQAVRFF